MEVPGLAHAVSSVLDGRSGTSIRLAADSLSRKYRSPGPPAALTDDERLAYLATRMPATAAVLVRLLGELAARDVLPAPRHVLDLGAGPGTTAWAAQAVWPEARVTLVERDAAFVELGRALAADGDRGRGWTWQRDDVTRVPSLPAADLAVLSYLVGEIDDGSAATLVDRAARAAPLVLVVEAGSAEGFAAVLRARQRLLSAGRFIVAPCPHDEPCPVAGTDWCHMTTRLGRSRLHRMAKRGQRAYEDEPYSFVAAWAMPPRRRTERIVARPEAHKGHVRLRICRFDGRVVVDRVTRADARRFRAARRARWGDPWSVDTIEGSRTVAMQWIKESPPRWDDHKARILGGAPAGIFDLPSYAVGDGLPGEWWRAEVDGAVAGYGWLDAVWGDAEILLVVAPEQRGSGVGTYILDCLQQEARSRGLNYLSNVVRDSHPDREAVTEWLTRRGFKAFDDGVLRRSAAHPQPAH
jgi:GNAT superfamily N-acetyltransferase